MGCCLFILRKEGDVMKLDYDRIRADVKRLEEEKAIEDMERGYCMLDFNVSDYFAYEVYKRYRDEVLDFLLTYADIIIESKEPFRVDMTDKIRNWIDCLDVAGQCVDACLMHDCGMMAYHLKVITGVFDKEIDPVLESYLITLLVKDRFSPYWKEMERLDYNDNYDEYLTQKMEEYKQWQNLH